MISTKIKNEAKSILLMSGQVGEICCYGDEEWYKFTPSETKYYTIYSEGSLDTEGYLYDSNGVQLDSDDDDGYGLNFKIVFKLTKGQTYYIKVKAFGTNTGHFGIMIVNTVSIEAISISSESMTMNKGDSTTLITTITPSYATNKSLKWSSSDSSVVSVKENSGLIIAHKPGFARITVVAQDGSNKSSCCEVTVSNSVSSITRSEYGDLEYNGKIYPIYVPKQTGLTISAVWNTVDTVYISDTKFNLFKFIAGFELPDEKTGLTVAGGNFVGETEKSVLIQPGYQPAVGIASLFAGVFNSLSQSINKVFVKFIFQETSDGQRRVMIKAGTTDAASVFNHYANDIPVSAYYNNSGSGFVQACISSSVANLYEEVTGNEQELLATYDCEVTVDKRHINDDGAVSYLWINKNGDITETPIIYPNDKVAFGVREGFWVFSTLDVFATVNLRTDHVADSKYQELFNRLK